MAASVRTFVVSWKEAADRKEFVARDALVIPSLTCFPVSYTHLILEMGFMTSQNDDLKMNDAEFQKTMVQGIANGIDSYFAS